MKVALFTETYLPDVNGVAAHLYTLKTGLEELGHEVLVVAADKYAKRHYVLDGVLHCPSIESKKLYGFGVAMPVSRRRFKLIAEFAPDIIHIHHEFGVGISGLFAAKKLNIPLVYTLHTMYDMYVHYLAPKALTTLATKISHKYEKFIAEQSTILASPSNKGKEYFEKIGVPQKEFFLVPNSADLSAFAPSLFTQERKLELRKKLDIPEPTTIICFVGRLGAEKSIDILLEYWQQEIKQDDNLHLLLIGDGPERESLEQLATTLGLGKMITFAGRVDHKYVPEYYAISDIFITASLSEMNSISMLEAMASGLPVLQRFDPINQDQITVGVNGYLYHTAPEMAHYIKQIAGLSSTEKSELKKQVAGSVAERGTRGLANYILNVYEAAFAAKRKEDLERKPFF